MTTQSTARLPKTTRKPVAGRIVFAVSIAAFLLQTPAQANTYLFSFTTSQVLSALATSQGSVEQSSAYFAIFVKPNLASYSYVSEWSPNAANPVATQRWTATTITDPADPSMGASTWAQFSKLGNTSQAVIVSDADNGTDGANIFIGNSYSSTTGPPIGWGSTTSTMVGTMDPSALFKFMIETPQTLSGPVFLSGLASALVSGSPFSFTNDTKDIDDNAFTLRLSPTYVPEPGTWVGAGAGILLLAAYRKWRARRRPTA